MIHMGYCILGIATLLSSSPIAWNILKTLVAYYLIYLAYKLIRQHTTHQSKAMGERKERDIKKSFLEGFFCDVLNPVVIVFFSASLPKSSIMQPHGGLCYDTDS